MKKGMLGFALVVVLLFYACASDVANRYYGDIRYPPKDPSQVEILKMTPTRPYTVIADFQSRGETPEDMRVKAAKIGADAVIVTTLGGYRAHGEQWAGEDTYGNTYSHICGTAIKYKD